MPAGHAEGFGETFRELYRADLPRGRRGRAAGRARLPDLRRRPRAGARRGRDRALARGGPVGRSAAVAAVFDCDGTLVDSEPLAGEAWRRALKPYGYAVTDEDLATTIGIPYARTHAYLAGRAEIPDAQRAVAGAQARAVRADRRAADPVPGCTAGGRGPAGAGRARSPSPRRRRASGSTARSPVRTCSSRSRSRATRSSTASPRRTCSCSRPSALGVEPRNCVVIEDSPPGVAAGKAAGMPTLGVRRVPGIDLSAADRIVEQTERRRHPWHAARHGHARSDPVRR